MSRKQPARTQQPPADASAAGEAVAEAPQPVPAARPLWLDEHLRTTPAKTRTEVMVREALWSHLSRVQAMVRTFVDEKVAEGFSEDDVFELFELSTPLAPRVTVDPATERVRVDFEVEVVERDAAPAGGE